MSIDNLKLIGLNIKDYFIDLVLLIVVGLFSNLVLNLLNDPLHNNLPLRLPDNYDIFPLPFDVVKIAVWIILFLIIRWSMDKRITTFLSSIVNNEYSLNRGGNNWTEARFKKEWIFQGNVHSTNSGLLITNSNSGCLIKPSWNQFTRIWKDFTATMEVEFPQQTNLINPVDGDHTSHQCGLTCQKRFNPILGIIFQAQNFDDYFLLELNLVNGFLVVRPHIRIGGNWDAPELNSDNNSYLLTGTNINNLVLELKVKKDKAMLYINGDFNNPITWYLPNFTEPRLIQHTSGGQNDRSKTVISEIYFRNRAGMFGFRNYGNELALVKSLDIY